MRIHFFRIVLKSFKTGWYVVTIETVNRRFFFVLLKGGVAIFLCHLIVSCLYFRALIDTLTHVCFQSEDCFWYRRGADAADSSGQAFRYSFEYVWRVAARRHLVEIRVCGLCVQTIFEISINNLERGVQKDVVRCGNVHCELDRSMKSDCKFNEVVKLLQLCTYFNVVNEL